MRGLLLAEKPSVMRAIKEVYEHEKALPYQLDFGAFHGHLMELKAPEDYDSAWADRDNVAILPLVPEQFAYKESDKASVDKLMNKIKGFREEGKPSLPLSAMAVCRALKHNGKPDYYTFVGHSDKVCSAKCMFVSKGDGWQFV